MRSLATAALAVVLGALPAAPARAISAEEARHLLARTGLGPTRAEIEALRPLSRAQAIDRVVGSARTTTTTEAPALESVLDVVRARRRLPGGGDDKDGGERRRAFREARLGEMLALKAWWANELLVTTSPFTEHLVLFWSNHFTSSLQKVKVASLLWEQQRTLRAHAAGDFRELLHAMVDDPAMAVYLDGNRNKAGAPNENFARELLELFTLGVPVGAPGAPYTEQDVKEAARAFSGTTYRPRVGHVQQRDFLRDRGPKTVLGVQGDLTGDDVVEILLRHPRTAEHVVEQLWRDLVSPDPDPREVKRLAAGFRSDWRIDGLVRALLQSDAFWAPEHRGVLVKSPVELVVGAARSLELVGNEQLTGEWVAYTVRALGQDLFDPPNVKGWPRGERWITALTLPDRERLAREAVAATQLHDDGDVPLATLLLPLPTPPGATLDDIARDPAFQLK